MNDTKRFYLSVPFMALVSFQVNFIRAARRESKNEIEKHNIDNNRTCYIATFYYEVNSSKTSFAPYIATRHVTHSIIY